MNYNVLWSSAAENDLKNILEYIAVDNAGNAIAILRKTKEKALHLNSLPERGGIVPELKDQGILTYRELVMPPWRLIYRISDQNVHMLSVLDSRRNVEDILLERLIDR